MNQEKGLELRICVAPELKGTCVRGDPLRFGQVLLNLVGNAIKFTETGHVTVRATRFECDRPSVGLHIEVQDSGIGIPDEYRARIFTAFEQANGSMARQYGGTGLGLAISKHLVELMDGKIDVTSAPGAGSTFSFDVWLTMGSNERAMPSGQAPHTVEAMIRGKHGGRRVLLVEDEPTNQEVARMLLDEVGLFVDLASDGAQAVDAARTVPYALILMDMQMPVMSGLDATRAIRAESANEDTPIVAMTANAFEEDRNACIEAGMNDHIGKPVDADTLYAVLLTQLDMSRA